jgi:hypothetical protein
MTSSQGFNFVQEYWIDAWQRSVLMLDVLCQRGNTHCRLPSDDIVQEAMMANTLSDKERSLIDAYWRAANYLSVGQIYLY